MPSLKPLRTLPLLLAGLVHLGGSSPLAERAALAALESPPSLRTVLYGNVVFGTVPVASSPITVTLTAPSSRVKARATVQSGRDGRFTALFGVDYSEFAALPERIEPGDRIAVSWSRDDPTFFDIPELTIETLPAEGLVVGNAPPGTRVEASHSDRWFEGVTGLDGRYRISLGSSGAFPRGTYGPIRVHVSDRLVVEGTWLAPKLIVDTQLGFSAMAPAGRQIAIAFHDSDGTLLDRRSVHVASDTIGGSVRGYTFDLNHLGGGRLSLKAGDVLEATIGDDEVTTRVAGVTAAASPERDVIEGVTEPGRTIRIGVQKRTASGTVERRVLPTTSDETGAFGVDFSGVFDITLGNQVDVVVVDAEGHETVMYFRSPLLSIDLDAGSVTGSAAPGSPVHLTLRRARSVLAEAVARSDAIGRFSASLLGDGGTARSIEPGDIVVATLPSSSAPMTATIPLHTLEVEPPSRRIAGSAEPEAAIEIHARPAFVGSGGYGSVILKASATGDYRYTVPPWERGGWDLHPGTVVEARQSTAEGHVVVRSWRAPLVSVEIGGARTCGLASPAAEVRLDLLDGAGARVGAAVTQVDSEGFWDAVLRDDHGVPLAVPVDPQLNMTIDGATQEIVVPPLSLTTEWAAPDTQSGLTISLLTGSMAPDSAYWLFGGSDGCMTGRTMPFGVTVREARSTDDGTFVERLLEHARGDATLIAASSPGHRTFAEARRGQVTVFKGTAELEAIGSPGAPFELVVTREDAGNVAEHRGQLDALGRADVSVDGTAPNFVFKEGDAVAVSFGEDAATFHVSNVDVDLQASGFIAAAPPGEPLDVTVALDPGDPLELSLVADEGGVLRLAFDTLLRRTGLEGTAVRGVTIAHVTPSGHRVAVRVRGRTQEVGRVWLPIAIARR